jgi:DsbC/DsbD-like thiol-disulfide interchange protein
VQTLQGIAVSPGVAIGEALVEYAGNPTAPNADASEAQPRVFLEGQQLAVGVLRHLVCQIEVPEGRHLYADPAPEGMVSFTMTLDAQSKLVARELIRPMSEAHTVAGTGEVIQVHHGRVELRLPITANAALTSTTESSMLDLKGEVRWQTCDDEVCDVPRLTQFEFSVPVEGSVVSEFMTKPGNPRVREMDGMSHFKKMSSRRHS